MAASANSGGARAPIALFVYDRPLHTQRTLEALAANKLAGESALTVFSDGPLPSATSEDIVRVQQVRDLVKSREWCKSTTIVERDGNLGLAVSIRTGVDHMLSMHDRVIVLEDDIETSPGFLEYMNSALTAFVTEPRVMHISAYLPATTFGWMLPRVFLTTHMSCWGWGTWKRAWSHAQWDAAFLLHEIDSRPGARRDFDMGGVAGFSSQLERNITGDLKTWAVRWAASIYLANGLCVMPGASLVRNTGVDGTGQHFRSTTSLYDVNTVSALQVRHVAPKLSRVGRFYLRSFFRYGKDAGLLTRLRTKLQTARSRIPALRPNMRPQ